MTKRELLRSLVGKPVQLQHSINGPNIDIYAVGVSVMTHTIVEVGDEMIEVCNAKDKRRFFVDISYIRQIVVAQ